MAKNEAARKLARETRAKVGEAMARLDAGDYDGAYEAAEAAQHAAYELKSEIDHAALGGRLPLEEVKS